MFNRDKIVRIENIEKFNDDFLFTITHADNKNWKFLQEFSYNAYKIVNEEGKVLIVEKNKWELLCDTYSQVTLKSVPASQETPKVILPDSTSENTEVESLVNTDDTKELGDEIKTEKEDDITAEDINIIKEATIELTQKKRGPKPKQ